MKTVRSRTVTPGGFVKTSFTFTAGQIENMDRIAAADKTDRAAVARKLLDLGLEAYQRQQRILRAIEAPIEEAV